MIPKRFEEITFSDIQALKDNAVIEGKTIEYKETIPSNADSEKVKFIAGISALANTIGGDFICGIKAVDGVPVDLPGLQISNIDAEKLRLEDILRNGIEPRLPGLEIKYLESNDGRGFFVIRVRHSWIAPHKVKANDKFYARTSAGKYPLDVSELRTAFMLSEQITERIRNFRQERVGKIQADEELPAPLVKGGKVILHLVPLSAFVASNVFSVRDLTSKIQFSPVASGEWNKKVNLDGVVVAAHFGEPTNGYTQVFRNGCIETVYCLAIPYNDENKDYSSEYDEIQLINRLSEYLNFYAQLEIEMPVYLFLTLVDIKDYKFHRYSRDAASRIKNKTFDRNVLILPETVINSYEQSPPEILRPSFDMIWNSFGFIRDLNYDEEGKWIIDNSKFS